jgi:predicted metalloprotease with PDZ domain
MVPEHYTVATALSSEKQFVFTANDYHQLADSPFIAGTNQLWRKRLLAPE